VNERLQELLIEAHKQSKGGIYSGNLSEWTEKFAQLIVMKCVEVALDERIAKEEIDKSDDIEDRCYLRGNNSGIVDAVIAIKQHFGVES
jgi:hypothetical protein